MKNILAAAAIATGLVGVLATSPSQAQQRVEAGLLSCNVAGGAGFIFGSTKRLACQFEAADGRVEQYAGTIRKFGIDIGATAESVIVWGVLAPTVDIPPDTLRGTYSGISAEATVGVGVGANALIGGNEESIVLQPVSVQAQAGLNVAAGITSIELVPVQ